MAILALSVISYRDEEKSKPTYQNAGNASIWADRVSSGVCGDDILGKTGFRHQEPRRAPY